MGDDLASAVAITASGWDSEVLYWEHEPLCGYIYGEGAAAGAAWWGEYYGCAECGAVSSDDGLGWCWDSQWEVVSLDVG